MLPPDRVQATAGGEPVPVVDTVHRAIARSPLLLRPVLALFAVAFLPWLLAPISVYRGVRSTMASLYVAAFGMWTFCVIDLNRLPRFLLQQPKDSVPPAWLFALLATPFAVAAIAHMPPLPRWFVPCRTVAWALLWSVPVAILVVQASPQNAMFAVIAVWVIAAAVIGWRAAKGSQEARMFGPDGVLAAYADPNAPPRPRPAGPASPPGPRRPARPAPSRPRPAGREHRPGRPGRARAGPVRRAGAGRGPGVRGPLGPQAAAGGRGGPVRAADHPRGRAGRAGRHGRARAGQGAGPLDLRVDRGGPPPGEAGFGADKPMRHFVFLGPPGTGKTTVARVIGKIFYAFGLLESANVVEAQRSDLVGEYLGATAIKTNELIDSALGRVLFIDEAYSLVNEGDGQSDRFGAEAVQTLLKRAEDDREHLIIILAGYEKQTEAFLATNPGLASRFATRIRFPTYSTRGAVRPGRAAAARQAGAAGGRRPAGAVADARGGGPPPHHRRARQRPVRPHAAGEGRPGA